MNRAALIVVYVLAFVVVAYVASDIYTNLISGKVDDASRRVMDLALGALIGLIARTGKDEPVEPKGTPADPISTEEVPLKDKE